MVLPSLSECAATFDRLAPVLLNAAARSIVVLSLAASVTLMMRRASAAARHWVWLLGFAGLLALPVVSSTLPGWHVLPWIGASHAASPASEIVVLPPAVLFPQPQVRQQSDALPVDTNSTASDVAPGKAPTATPPQASAVKRAAPLQAGAPAAVAESAELPAQASNLRIAALPWTVWLALCWLTGTLLVLGYVFLGHLSLWWLQRRCARANPGDLPDLLDQLRQEIGVRREVQLLSSPMRTMPMTWGLWRPRLLLPEQALTWPPEQRRSVLLHELSHVKRWDCLTQLLAQFACALYWFNPIGWIAARRMQIERERACDDMVLNTGAEPSSYARHLLHSVSSMPAFRLTGAAVAMARLSTLEERLRAILDVRRNRRALTFRGGLLTVLLLSAALAPVALLKAQEAPVPVPAPVAGASASAPVTAPADNDATSTPTSAPSGGTATTDSPEVQQLRKDADNLQRQLLSMRGEFGEEHPDVKRVKRLLAQIQAQLVARGAEAAPTTAPSEGPASTDSPEVRQLRKEADAAQMELILLRNKFGEEHPAVKRMEAALAQIQGRLVAKGAEPANNESTPTTAPSDGSASTDSPEVQQLRKYELGLELQLADLRGNYSENNPNVMRVKRQLAEVQAQLAARAAGSPPNPATVPIPLWPTPAPRPDSPARTDRPSPSVPRFGGGNGFGVAARPAPPTPKDAPTCTFDATIYDVRIPADQIGRLDVDALSRAATSADAFEKALAALGTTQPLYRANQSFRISGDNIEIGTEVPIITSTRVDANGKAINSISYQAMGANFAVSGNTSPTGALDLDLSIQLSAVSNGGAPMAGDVKAPLFRRATMSHKGPVQPRKSFVVVSVDASSVDAAGKAVAYVGRITIGEPQSTNAAR
jgi:beta-lactamase regulating signal transducer with metallopeptidase domain